MNNTINIMDIIKNNNSLDSFPLTSTQMAYMMGRGDEQAFGGVATHAYYEITTEIDSKSVENALNKIIKSQQMLRTVVSDNGMQYILDEVPYYTVLVDDYTGLSDSEQNQEILKQREHMAQQIFPLNTWPMYELKMAKKNDGKYYIFVSIDLLIADGMSIMILFDEIVNCCLDNKDASSCDVNFKEYLEFLDNEKNNIRYLKNKEYFDKKIPEIPLAPDIKNKSDKITYSPYFARKDFSLTPEEWINFQTNAKKHNCTPTIALACAYAFVLAHYCSQEEFSLNFTATDRNHMKSKDISKMIGDFTTIMLVEINREMFECDIFWDCVKKVKKSFINSYRHMPYDGMKLIGQIAQYHEIRNNAVMPFVFTGLLFKDNLLVNAARIGKCEYRCSQTPQVFIDCQVIELNDKLCLSWDYVEKIFDPDMIDNMFNELSYIIKALSYGEDKIKENIKLNSKDLEILTKYNNTAVKYPENMNLLKLLEPNFKKFENKIAVLDDKNNLTYSELDILSNIVATDLINKGVKSGEFVAVSASRCVETIVNILGILKCGAAYVPINPEYPEDRQQYIVKHSNCKFFLSEVNVNINNVDKIDFSSISNTISGDSPAYVIYTSGSTGTPKGVLISHDAVCNTLISVNEKFDIGSEDIVIGISSFCFDLSVYDIFGTFTAGATLRLARDARDISNLADIVYNDNITVWNTVPAIMELFCEEYHRKCEARIFDLDCHNRLKTVMLSGDWIPLALPEKIKNEFDMVKVYSLGGATEASIWSIYYPIDEIDDEWNSIPYGYPLDNQTFFVLDHKMNMCPIGVIGELYIGGRGVADGYLNDPEKTMNAFLEHPNFGRIYKTGDYGIMNKTGFIEFMGRKDGQIKLRGHRIELGEIENALCSHNNIEGTVVTVSKNDNGRSFIVAYYICDSEIDTSDLFKFLGSKLPEYMLPEHFVKIDELPLTSNGKINRKALPKIQLECVENIVEPTTDTEKLVCDILEKILGITNISINENFFKMGIDSIKAVRVVSAFREIGYEIMVKDIMYYSSVKEISEFIDKNNNEKSVILNTNNNAFKLYNSNCRSNNSVIINTGEKTHEDICEVVYKLIQHHNILDAVLDGELIKIQPLQSKTEYVDISNISFKELKFECNTYRLKKSNRLFTTEYITTEKDSYTILCANEIIADYVSWNIILEDFMSLILDINCALPDKTIFFMDALNRINNSLCETDNKDYELTKDNENSQDKLLYKSIERNIGIAETNWILEDANTAYNTETRDIVLAALTDTLHEFLDVFDINVNVPIYTRGSFGKMLVARTIGNLSPNIFVKLQPCSNAENSIVSVKETLRKLPKDAVGLAKIQKESNSNSSELNVFFDDISMLVSQIDNVVDACFSPNLKTEYFSNDINILLSMENQCMHINIIYNEIKYDKELICNVADKFIQKLTEYIKHCISQENQISTVSDFTDEDISLDELNLISDMI